MKNIGHRTSQTEYFRGFTLVELLVVISIIGLLAGFTIPVLGELKKAQYKKVARAELASLAAALESYKAKYGVYPPGNANDPLMSQLYYELSGTIKNGNAFVPLDGTPISANNVKQAYGVGGFINCTQGSGEDTEKAINFITGLTANQFATFVTNNSVPTTILITSVRGPDEKYQPLNAPGLNPFRYRYPGISNPGGYDLWVQLVIKGKSYLICNWSRQEQINSPLP